MASPIITTHTRPTTARPARRARLARTATLLLGLYFVANGALKLAAPQALVTSFAHWGYPSWFLYAVGALELGAGLLVVFPRTTALGAFLLAGTMAGAVLTHVDASEWTLIPLPVALTVVSVWIAWGYAPAAFKSGILELQRAATMDP